MPSHAPPKWFEKIGVLDSFRHYVFLKLQSCFMLKLSGSLRLSGMFKLRASSKLRSSCQLQTH